jgi:hypothetical protein
MSFLTKLFKRRPVPQTTKPVERSIPANGGDKLPSVQGAAQGTQKPNGKHSSGLF